MRFFQSLSLVWLICLCAFVVGQSITSQKPATHLAKYTHFLALKTLNGKKVSKSINVHRFLRKLQDCEHSNAPTRDESGASHIFSF